MGGKQSPTHTKVRQAVSVLSHQRRACGDGVDLGADSARHRAAAAERVAALVAWLKGESISWDEEAISVNCDPICLSAQLHSVATQPAPAFVATSPPSSSPPPLSLSGDGHSYAFSITAKDEVPVGRALVTIPKTAVLSIKTTCVADLIEAAELGGSLGLAVAVMCEIERGPSSPWFGYLQSLPSHSMVPLFWTPTERALLEGTELHNYVEDYGAALDDDFETLVLPVVEANPALFPPETATPDARKLIWKNRFLRATSLVSSRAFEVDSYHGTAMVPFADLFNHRSGAEHVHIESEGDSPKPPSLPPITSSHEELAKYSIKALKAILQERNVDASGCFEKADLVNRIIEQCGPSNTTEEEDCPSLFDERLEIVNRILADSDDEGEEVEDSLEMRVVLEIKAGDEVFNTYGDHTNASLLSRYGFVEADNPFDVVCIHRDVLVSLLVDDIPAKRLSDRIEFWNCRGRKLVNSVLQENEEEEAAEGSDVGDGEENTSNDGTQSSSDEWDDITDDSGSENNDEDDEDSGLAEDNLKFNIDHEGKASAHLLVFLHVLHAESKAFTALTTDESVLLRYIRHLIAAQGESWVTEPMGGSGDQVFRQASQTKKQTGTGLMKTRLNASPSPIGKSVCATLSKAIDARLARLPSLGRESKSLPPTPAKWALMLREEETKILKKAKKRYFLK
ncbi:hypothetical protein DFJ73DRAFT_779389 [Zopfochytrium polystomum]|nr:hypothetical protein DFJ73DRAFT_779389 [Zopfochytrium polystomum]